MSRSRFFLDEGRTGGSSIPEYSSPPSPTRSYALKDWAALRDAAKVLSEDVDKGHQEARGADLDDRAAQKVRGGLSSLLGELAESRGVSWTDLARLVGVSVPAVRKWRRGGDASGAHQLALAKLAAFLDILSELAVSDPASWMEIPLALPAGYYILPNEIYIKGTASDLLELAAGRIDATNVMDRYQPDWRAARYSDLEVVEGPDGDRALRVREDGGHG